MSVLHARRSSAWSQSDRLVINPFLAAAWYMYTVVRAGVSFLIVIVIVENNVNRWLKVGATGHHSRNLTRE